ncbi:hypothetical protein CCR75_006623 [Bremia lactucae]|uniref:Condensin-2 complex subunit H2 n=1 Tax=Bremia lactucae TaxID=4779 RepID=A0A976FI29_BRELC|nr:hypothetical protein CCR75_006623 [Bremia lactucae]
MDKLEHLPIAFDASATGAGIASHGDGSGVMNFAEAALLIQGTSVIYSRKVEYLHALVYQTLAHLSHQGDMYSNSEVTTTESTNRVAIDTEESAFSCPLPLYDELEEARPGSITLKRATEAHATTQTNARALLHRSKNNIQASIALMGSLVPDERDHGETFKLLSCPLHSSGVLLFDDASKKYLETPTRGRRDLSLAFGYTPEHPQSIWESRDSASPVKVLNVNDLDALEQEHPDDCDENDELPSYELESNGMEPSDDGLLGELTSQMATTLQMKPCSTSVWTPLDAYDASASVSRPFRKGRSYPRVKASTSQCNGTTHVALDALDGLVDASFQDRFLNSGCSWASWVWTDILKAQPLTNTCARRFCKARLFVKMCDVLWQREAKWRNLLQRYEARATQSAQALLLREQATEEEEKHERGLSLSTATARLDHAARNDDVRSRSDDEIEEFDDGDWDAGTEQEERSVLNLDTLGMATNEPSLPSRTYEEICREHLATFMAGTETYMRESDLSKKVNEWQEKLTPLLLQQDTRPPFDIHASGRDLLTRLHEAQLGADGLVASLRSKKRARVERAGAVPFETLVDGKRPFEVCRLFLASLQLANTGNVALTHAFTAAEDGQGPFAMQLVRTTYDTLPT